MSYTSCVSYLREVAFRMELAGDKFRTGAYTRALDSLLAAGSCSDYETLPGVGTSIRTELAAVLAGTTPDRLLKLRADGVPESVVELTTLRNVGVKKAMSLHSLGISSVEALAEAVRNHEIADPDVISAYYASLAGAGRLPRHHATSVFESVVPLLQGLAQVHQALPCGGYRRQKSDLESLEILVVVRQARSVNAIIKTVSDLLAAPIKVDGQRKASIPFDFGDHVRDLHLHFCTVQEAGCAYAHFTGSPRFNASCARAAEAVGLVVHPYSVSRGDEAIYFSTEDDFFKAINVPVVAPELRDHYTDFEAEVPAVVTGVVADFRMFSDFSNGTCSIDVMVKAAAVEGYKVYGVCDAVNRKITPKTVATYADDVRSCAGPDRIAVAGLEISVLATGGLDFPVDFVQYADYVFLALHDRPQLNVIDRLSGAVKRLRAAFPNKPLALAHPTGRTFGNAPASDIDYKSLFRLCAAENVALEINGTPSRMDLDDSVIRLASKYRCRFICSSGAKSAEQIKQISNAVTLAKRGLLEPSSVINSNALRVRHWLEGSDLRGMQ